MPTRKLRGMEIDAFEQSTLNLRVNVRRMNTDLEIAQIALLSGLVLFGTAASAKP